MAEGESGDNSTDDELPEPISSNQTHELCKELSDASQVQTAGSDYLAQELTNVVHTVIEEAEEKRVDRDDARLEEEHIRETFEDLLKPYALIDDILTIMGEYEYELKKEATRTGAMEFEAEDE